MTDLLLVIFTVVATVGFTVTMTVRAVVAEYGFRRGSGHDRRPLLRWLDRGGVILLVLILAAVVVRVAHTVL